MMRLLLPVLTVCIVLVACSDKDKVPGNIIPKAKMEKVLWDMVQAERFSSTFLIKDSPQNVKEETLKLYEQVFSLHKITKEEFVKSYKFYLSRPDIARVMFDSLSTHANKVREDMNKAQAASDSAKAAKAKADTTKVKADTAKINAAKKDTLKPFPIAPISDTARFRSLRMRRDSLKMKPIRRKSRVDSL